jgi:hypothetical protein
MSKSSWILTSQAEPVQESTLWFMLTNKKMISSTVKRLIVLSNNATKDLENPMVEANEHG